MWLRLCCHSCCRPSTNNDFGKSTPWNSQFGHNALQCVIRFPIFSRAVTWPEWKTNFSVSRTSLRLQASYHRWHVKRTFFRSTRGNHLKMLGSNWNGNVRWNYLRKREKFIYSYAIILKMIRTVTGSEAKNFFPIIIIDEWLTTTDVCNL